MSLLDRQLAYPWKLDEHYITRAEFTAAMSPVAVLPRVRTLGVAVLRGQLELFDQERQGLTPRHAGEGLALQREWRLTP